ncbi:MAG: sporulation transcriptional regulator SpoIIID [Bacillus sp. (in: Bacteria)]|nr:sporulation transcriptional regulator SpoIIID [Bacillus sp. (in: firmicutes)]
MNDKLHKKVIEVAKYTIATKSTTRETADKFGLDKSTIHVYLTKRLPTISPTLYDEVKKVIQFNKSERSARAGVSARENLKKIKLESQTIFDYFSDMELLVRYGELYRKHKQNPTQKNESLMVDVMNEIIKRMKRVF